MDASQDWIIQDGSEQNGTTVLRFSRKLVTCDPTDQPITVTALKVFIEKYFQKEKTKKDEIYLSLYAVFLKK